MASVTDGSLAKPGLRVGALHLGRAVHLRMKMSTQPIERCSDPAQEPPQLRNAARCGAKTRAGCQLSAIRMARLLLASSLAVSGCVIFSEDLVQLGNVGGKSCDSAAGYVTKTCFIHFQNLKAACFQCFELLVETFALPAGAPEKKIDVRIFCHRVLS